MPLKLKVVTPENEALNATCDEVTAPGVDGELGFGSGHVPLITALKPGLLTVRQGNQKTVYAISTGFAEIEDEKVTVLTEACELSTNINVEQTKRDIAEAEAALQGLGEQDADFAVHRLRLDRNYARLAATQQK